MMWILMSVAESSTHKEGRNSWARVVTAPLPVALGVPQSINNPARPTSHRSSTKAWSYHPGRGPIDGSDQSNWIAPMSGRIKSRLSRILRPMPRRRAIVAPRFGKWARVRKTTSMERKPTRPDQLPRLHFSVPCSGNRSRGEKTLYLFLFKLCYLTTTQTRCTGRAGVPRISPSYYPGSSSAIP